jgi:hypothetical protein
LKRRDASPIRPGYGDAERPHDDFYGTSKTNNTYASIERESRGRTRYRHVSHSDGTIGRDREAIDKDRLLLDADFGRTRAGSESHSR